MADLPPKSSQDSIYEQHKITLDKENFPSSPPRPQSRSGGIFSSQKIKKPPTVTPKRFNKFFQPRTTSTRAGRTSKAGRQLRDITRDGANRRASGLSRRDDFLHSDDQDFQTSRPLKRRKHATDLLASSPPQSSPLRNGQIAEPIPIYEDDLSEAETLPDLFAQVVPFPKPIRRLREPGPSRRIMERSFGGFNALSRGFKGVGHGTDWRAETAHFVSTPNDLHAFRGPGLPFCTTACNTNSMVAVGDEEGSVRLFDSSQSSRFSDQHVKFRAHHNAVMDIAFSSDDYLLATASGDQTGRVVDMQTQQIMCILSGHKSSVKQIRFQPNDDNMITTSARDGCVQLWDLRCGGKSAVQNFRASLARAEGAARTPDTRYGRFLEVGFGHRSDTRRYDVEARDELSITSFQHLKAREHMIVTSSEVDASVKLWDLRNAGRRNPIPLSATPVPDSHGSKRHFGINSMAMSGDGSRLYTVCRDATIYAYSTNQLVLGQSPEMSSAPSRRRMLKEPMAGLGPLYGFRNSNLRLATFYIKASMRPAQGDNCEMLAVGSSNKCPIVFPTDERHVPRRERPSQEDDEEEEEEEDEDMGLPSVAPPKSFQPKPDTGLHVFEHGTALIGAHNKEVTSLAWTTAGDLISVSDDFTARCWRHDAGKARELRKTGDFGGGRWRAGWAGVDAEWDEEEC